MTVASDDDPMRRVLAWDVPTRLFKWALVLLVVDAWLSNKYGAATSAWHKWNGYAVLVAVVFRILWGFFGGSTARFSHFVRPWKALVYLPSLFRIPGTQYLGHNPLGGLWIVAILGLCFLQGALGLYSSDEDRVVIEGPLASTVSSATVDAATHWHGVIFDAIMWLAVLHLAAVFFYDILKGYGLLPAMIWGTKPGAFYADEQEAAPGSPVTALLCLLAAVVLVFGAIAALGGSVLR